jgi:hypothetical protein
MINRLLKTLGYIFILPIFIIGMLISLVLQIPLYIIFNFNSLEYWNEWSDDFEITLRNLNK